MKKDNIDIVVEKRTIGDWKIRHNPNGNIEIETEAFNYSGRSICVMDEYNDQREANAEAICKSVNEYDNLKEQNTKLAANNKCLLEALIKVIQTAHDIPFYFTDKKYKSLYIQTEKAKEAIKANETTA